MPLQAFKQVIVNNNKDDYVKQINSIGEINEKRNSSRKKQIL